MKGWILMLCCLFWIPGQGVAAGNEKGDTADALEIRLITFSPRDNLFEWFGHTVLEVRNLDSGESLSYSFGGFTFRPEDLLMFTMGKFRFWSTVEPTEPMLRYYRHTGRHIVYQTLNLTPEQEYRLCRHLVESVRPENRRYLYDHFLDNCSTRIRDAIDDALKGEFKVQTSELTGLTFRDYVHRMTAHQPGLNFLLNYVLSNGVDRPVTYWESMFLPDRLMVEVQKAVIGEDDSAVSRPLVKYRQEKIWGIPSRFFSEDPTVPRTWPRESTAGLLMGVLFGGAGWSLLKNRRLGRILYPLLTALFGLVFGFLGIGLFFMTCIAEHKDVYWNENFFLASPLTFLLLPAGIAMLWGKGRRLFCWTGALCGLAAVCSLALKILPAFDQANGQQVRVMLPALLVIGFFGCLELRRSGSRFFKPFRK